MLTIEEEAGAIAREFRIMKVANASGKLQMVGSYLIQIMTATTTPLHRREVAGAVDTRISIKLESVK